MVIQLQSSRWNITIQPMMTDNLADFCRRSGDLVKAEGFSRHSEGLAKEEGSNRHSDHQAKEEGSNHHLDRLVKGHQGNRAKGVQHPDRQQHHRLRMFPNNKQPLLPLTQAGLDDAFLDLRIYG
jgi:hypothetical protein